jgi:hypothetical protein
MIGIPYPSRFAGGHFEALVRPEGGEVRGCAALHQGRTAIALPTPPKSIFSAESRAVEAVFLLPAVLTRARSRSGRHEAFFYNQVLIASTATSTLTKVRALLGENGAGKLTSIEEFLGRVGHNEMEFEPTNLLAAHRLGRTPGVIFMRAKSRLRPGCSPIPPGLRRLGRRWSGSCRVP